MTLFPLESVISIRRERELTDRKRWKMEGGTDKKRRFLPSPADAGRQTEKTAAFIHLNYSIFYAKPQVNYKKRGDAYKK